MAPLAYPEKSSRKIFTKGKKRGQFYLLSAIIIISIIIGFSTISTYTKKGGAIKIFDLGEELGIESANVLDYGTFPANQVSDLDALLENFVGDYADYLGEDREISFVFGNPDDNTATVVNYEEEYMGTISDISTITTTKRTSDPDTESVDIEEDGDVVTIKFKDKDYKIKLKPGENFFFVISEDIGEETYVFEQTE